MAIEWIWIGVEVESWIGIFYEFLRINEAAANNCNSMDSIAVCIKTESSSIENIFQRMQMQNKNKNIVYCLKTTGTGTVHWFFSFVRVLVLFNFNGWSRKRFVNRKIENSIS